MTDRNIQQVDINIRRAIDKDADAILMVHYDSVHATAKQNYEAAILNEWAPSITASRIESHRIEFEDSYKKLIFVVAEISGEVVGFGMYVPDTREISAIYVSPKAGRTGIGTMLLSELENIVQDLGINQVWLQSTLNAEKFYLKNGFIRENMGDYTFPSGLKMSNVKMYKNLC